MTPGRAAQSRVTVVITNYNYGRFLDEAIQSALAQTHPALEVILVDDGSTDDSLEVAARYPIQVVTQANAGVSSARNAGAARATGSYLLFLDADDLLEPLAVEHLLTALEDGPPQVAYAYSQMRFFGTEDRLYEAKPFSAKALIAGTFVNASSLIRRSAFEAVGGWDPTWRLALEDYELWLRMLHHGFHGVLVPEPLLRYRQHGPSRNLAAVTARQQLKWRLILTYPRFFWRKILKHPLKSLLLYLKLGDACRRREPLTPSGPGAAGAPRP